MCNSQFANVLGLNVSSRRVGSGAPASVSWGKDLLQDLGDLDRSLDPLIEHEAQFWRVADLDLLAILACKKPAAFCRPRRLRFCWVSSPITDTWTLACRRSARYLDVRHGDVADPGILQLRQDRHADDFAERFGGFFARREGMEDMASE